MKPLPKSLRTANRYIHVQSSVEESAFKKAFVKNFAWLFGHKGLAKARISFVKSDKIIIKTIPPFVQKVRATLVYLIKDNIFAQSVQTSGTLRKIKCKH